MENVFKCVQPHVIFGCIDTRYLTALYDAYMEQKDYVNVRVRKQTQIQLRIVAALSQESMLDTLERLVATKLDRLQKGGENHVTLQKNQD